MEEAQFFCGKEGVTFDARRWFQGCRELASEVGRVSERTKFKRSSSSSGPDRGRRSIAPDVDLESSGSDEKQVSLARMESGRFLH